MKLIAFDLDGTLTQHKTPLEEGNRAFLSLLSRHYRLLMVGAGDSERIASQMDYFPIEILGNYGTVLKSFEMKAGDSVRITLEEGTALQISDGTCVLISD